MKSNSSLLDGADTPMPEGDSSGPTQPPPPPSFPDKMLSQAQARFDAMKSEVASVAKLRKAFDTLTDKGDAVTEDNVLDEISTLVAHGADPKMFAAMISGNAQSGVGPMPPQGEPLARWLMEISQGVLAPYEAKLRPAMALAQHQLGVAAMHKMVDVHAKQFAAQAPLSPLPAPNTPAPSLLQ